MRFEVERAVALSEGLSNPSQPLPDLISSVGCDDSGARKGEKASRTSSPTGGEAHKARPRHEQRANSQDARRRFGTVGRAIVKMLAHTGEEMSVKTIRAEVKQLLGGSVSRFSIADYLLRR